MVKLLFTLSPYSKPSLTKSKTNTWSNYCSNFHPIRNYPSQSQKHVLVQDTQCARMLGHIALGWASTALGGAETPFKEEMADL
jgi:hypothetical protein